MEQLNDHPKINLLLTQTKHNDDVACTELYLTRLTADHKLPFVVADHSNRYAQDVVPLQQNSCTYKNSCMNYPCTKTGN